MLSLTSNARDVLECSPVAGSMLISTGACFASANRPIRDVADW